MVIWNSLNHYNPEESSWESTHMAICQDECIYLKMLKGGSL